MVKSREIYHAWIVLDYIIHQFHALFAKVKSAAPDAGLILVVPYQPHQAEPGLVGKVDSSETNKSVDCS